MIEMMDHAGIDDVEVAAPPGCEEDARKFYGELLGMRELSEHDDGCWFECGPQRVHLRVQPSFRPALKARSIRLTDRRSYEALAARLQAAGVVVKHGDAGEGTPRFFAGDPWGNRLEMTLAA